jgi:hypothetical protein
MTIEIRFENQEMGGAPLRRNPRARGWYSVCLNYPNEDHEMSASAPEDPEKRKRRQRNTRMIVGLFMLMGGVPPLVNALGNPRVQTLHTPDVMGLIAAGLCFGFGLGLLLSKLMFRA